MNFPSPNLFLFKFKVELKFNEPFFGIAYANFDRTSACIIAGKGDISYQLELPLKGCGTVQVRRARLIFSLHPLFVERNNSVVIFLFRNRKECSPTI